LSVIIFFSFLAQLANGHMNASSVSGVISS